MLNDKKGMMLVSSFMILSMISVASLGLATRHMAFLLSAERNQNRMIAFNMAEAGVDLAMAQLSTNTSYAGTGGYTALGTQGGYTVSVCPPTCTGMTAPTDSNVRLIQASGQAPSNTSTDRAYEARSITSYTYLNKAAFAYALFGDSKIKVGKSAKVDSYNSNDGAYGGANVKSTGDLGTDSTSNNAIIVGKNSTVKGDIDVGVGGNPATVIKVKSGATVTGTQSAQTQARDYQPMSSAITSSGELKITKSTLTLPAGTYRYDKISISGSGKLSLLGATTIYVDGKVKIEGKGVETASNKPTNLLLIETTTKSVRIKDKEFYGAIYAPQSYVMVKGKDLYGAVIADRAHIKAGEIHYDEATKDINAIGAKAKVSVLSWRETNTTAA